jgi:iron complex outermembrane receptor protein
MKRPGKLGLAIGCATVMGAASAIAQDAATPPETSTGAIEKVVVTAQKKKENVQKVPISTTVLSGDQLERSGITGVEDVARRSPGLQFGNFSERKLDPTALRGISASTPSAGLDPAVGYYLDEVFLGSGVGANIDYFDIDRIEVLRGPQGTLFGRNTVGGIINIVTRSPSKTFEAYAGAEYGDYDYWRLIAAASGPIVEDTLYARVAGAYLDRDGLTTNAFLGERGNDSHNENLRGSLLWTPDESVEFLLSVDYRTAEEKPKLFETLKYNTASLFHSLLGSFGAPENTNPFDRVVFSDLRSEETLEGSGAALRASIDLSDNLQLVSVSSYRTHEYFNIGDTDMSPLRWAYDGDPEEVWRASEEIRLSSDGNEHFDWLLGFYYFRQHTANDSFISFGTDFSLVLTGDPDLLDGLRVGSNGVLETESYAVFGSGTVKFADNFDVTVGGRYTVDDKAIDYSQSDPLALLGGDVVVIDSDRWNAFTPSFTARYFLNDDVMTYATASQGFKSGGFNDGLGVADGISFGPEYVWNYEAGVKSAWFNHRLIANASLFLMRWRDIQLSADDPNTPVFDPRISNAGRAHSQGLDFEFIAAVSDRLTVRGNLELLDSKYDEGVIPTTAGSPGIPLRHLVRAPTHQFALSGDYRVPLGWADLDFSVEYLGNGPMYLTLDNQADGRSPAYGLINARVTLEELDGGWRVSLWGKNLADETYTTRLFDLFDQDLIGQKLIELGQPRTIGIQVHKSFP